LFPLSHYIYEGHLLLPWVHKIKHYDLLLAYIKLLSRIGLGKFRTFQQKYDTSLEDFSERHADYIHYFTNYISYNEVLKLAKWHKMRVSFKYTQEFYFRKIAIMMGKEPSFEYKHVRSIFVDFLAILLLKYISSITLFLEKKEKYTGN